MLCVPYSILTHEELTGVIKYEKLEALLPDNILQSLEEQFLAHKEVYVSPYLSTQYKLSTYNLSLRC